MTYSTEDIIRYVTGDMDETERHEIEKASLQDPLLAGALEGYEAAAAAGDLEKLTAETGDFNDILKAHSAMPGTMTIADEETPEEEEEKTLRADAADEQGMGKAAPSQPTFFRYAAGIAAILVLIVGGYYLFNKQTPGDMAKKQPADSINQQPGSDTGNGQMMTVPGQPDDNLVAGLAKKDFSESVMGANELKLLFKNGSYDEYIDRGEEELKTAVRKDSVTIISYIARSYILLGETDSALSVIARAPAAIQLKCEVKYVKALALYKAGRPEEARNVFWGVTSCPAYVNTLAPLLTGNK